MVASGPTELTPFLRPQMNGSEKYLAAASMMVCAYNIMVVDTLLLCLHQRSDLVYWEQSMLAAAALVGALIGAAVFGVCGDTYGRYQAFTWACCVMLVGSIASACCYASSTLLLVLQLSMCRYVVGFGVGGLYPLVAAIVTENVRAEHGPFAVAITFSMQGIGFLISSLIPVALFGAQIHTESVWRLSLLAGAVPVMFILYQWRMLKPVIVNAAMQAYVPRDGEAFADYSIMRIVSKHSGALAGTSSTWFLSSFVFYGLACSRSQIAQAFITPQEHDPNGQLFHANMHSVLFAAATIPGFLIMVACIDRIGVRTLQACGFGFMGLTCMCVVHFTGHIQSLWITAVLSFAFFFSCAGPNSTTYVLPAVYYPVSERSTCHGISGAVGKMGAIIGGAAFPIWNEAFGVQGVVYACSIACFAGMVCTLALCPSPDVQLNKMAKRDPLKYFDAPVDPPTKDTRVAVEVNA